MLPQDRQSEIMKQLHEFKTINFGTKQRVKRNARNNTKRFTTNFYKYT